MKGLFTVAAIATVVAVHVAGSELPDPSKSKIARLVEDGGWCWFADPRAIRRNDVTYFGYINSEGNIIVSTFNHSTSSQTSFTLHEKLAQCNGPRDDHGNPSIVFLPDDRLMAFYAGHSLGPVYCRTSTRPLDISSWEPEQKLSLNVEPTDHQTYPNPYILSSEKNRMFLFWRGGPWQCMSWSDDFKTWAPAKRLFNSAKRPYFKYVSDGRKCIHAVFTDGHPAGVEENNIYYACYHDGSFWRANGTKMCDLSSLPFDPSQADKIHDAKAAKARGWTWDIALDGEYPVIVHSVLFSATDHRYRYVRWDGTEWKSYEITPAGGTIAPGAGEDYYSGGIILDHTNPKVVYLSRQIGKSWEIERWETPDHGATWKSQAITSNTQPPLKNVRPVCPYERQDGSAQVLWMQGVYTHWTNYKSDLLAWPMDGLVKK